MNEIEVIDLGLYLWLDDRILDLDDRIVKILTNHSLDDRVVNIDQSQLDDEIVD